MKKQQLSSAKILDNNFIGESFNKRVGWRHAAATFTWICDSIEYPPRARDLGSILSRCMFFLLSCNYMWHYKKILSINGLHIM